MTKKKNELDLDYYAQQSQNEFAFKEMLKTVRPELFMLMDLLDSTGLEPMILLKVMRHLNNLATGSKYGVVSIHMEDGIVTFVRGEESDKVNLKTIDPAKKRN